VEWNCQRKKYSIQAILGPDIIELNVKISKQPDLFTLQVLASLISRLEFALIEKVIFFIPN